MIDGVAVAGLNAQPEQLHGLRIQQGSKSAATIGRPLYDDFTYANLYQPYAALVAAAIEPPYVRMRARSRIFSTSTRTIEVFHELGRPFETVDVLASPAKREAIKRYSNWPTIPQVYIDGKFVGGCDILHELHERGELEPMLKAAFSK